MENEKNTNRVALDVATDSVLNTYRQSKTNKEFSKDLKKMLTEFHKFSGKYGHQIAGFYLIKKQDSNWMLAVATDGEIK